MALFYPIIIVLGLFSSYTDLKLHKIRNSHLLFAILAGLIIYAWLFFSQQLVLKPNLLINLVIGLSLGLILYLNDVWGAGDAKLFFVLCFLFPIERNDELLPYNSVVIFLNIFLLGLIVISIASFHRIIGNIRFIFKRDHLIRLLRRIFESFMIVLSLSWIIPIATNPFQQYLTLPLNMVIMYLAYALIFGLVSKNKDLILIAVIFTLGLTLRMFVQPEALSLHYIYYGLSRSLSYSIVFFLLYSLLEPEKKGPQGQRIVPFAPLIFIGTLTANTGLIYFVAHALNSLAR